MWLNEKQVLSRCAARLSAAEDWLVRSARCDVGWLQPGTAAALASTSSSRVTTYAVRVSCLLNYGAINGAARSALV